LVYDLVATKDSLSRKRERGAVIAGCAKENKGSALDEQLHARVAWLYHMEGLIQAEIAERLGLTRLRVNRILSECRASGLVRITLNSRIESCVMLEEELRRRCGLEGAVIVPTPDDPDKIPGIVGLAAAEYLSRHLEQNRLAAIGVGWGATLRETIRNMRQASFPELWVTSMMGGLTQGLELNTFEIAGELARRLQANCRYLAAPIYAASARSRDTILAQEVFGEVMERLARIELALLSLGDLSPRSLLIRHGLPRDVPVEELRAKGAVGDVLGQFLDSSGKPINHGINRRAIALPLDKLAEVRTVVLIAGGSNKMRIIAAALKGGFSDVLITDEKTAAGALTLIERER
jgi:lsr operon transcriptional repressor